VEHDEKTGRPRPRRTDENVGKMRNLMHSDRRLRINQAHHVEILMRLREAVRIKGPEYWPNDWILLHVNAPAHDALSVKQFLAQKLITEMEHPLRSPDSTPNDF
jgi:hypothetical protein